MNTSDARPVRPWLVLTICCFSLLLVSMDATIVNVALPSIRRDFGASTAALQWVLDAYTVVVASLLMLSGSLADRFGRRRTFQVGLLLFTAASALCSLARSIELLVAARALQAVGASMLNPVAMSIITNTFLDPRARARAIGAWSAVVGVAMALGPLVGGALTQTVGWRWVFWVNVPIGLGAVLLAQRFVPESRAPQARRIDLPGQLLALLHLSCLICAVIEGPRLGWSSPETVVLFAVAAAALVAFLLLEPRVREPMVELRLFLSVPFTSAAVTAVAAFGAFSGFLFLNALYLQEARGLAALRTGLLTLPLALATIVSAPVSGWLVGRAGTRLPLTLAGTAMAVSALMLTRLDVGTPLGWLLLAYVLFGVGFGLVNAPITNTAVAGLPRTRAGLAAAIASTSRQVGASLGVAVGGTLARAHDGGGRGFAEALHPFFWLAAGAGLLIVALAQLSNSAWGQETLRRAAALFAGEAEAQGGRS